MFIQSLFVTIFTLIITTLFAVSTCSAVHTLAIAQEQRTMLTAADDAVAAMRTSSQTTMQTIATQPNILPLLSAPVDANDRTGMFSVHTAIDAAAANNQTVVGAMQGCDVHDIIHQCNLSVGSGLAEQRLWITIDVRSVAAKAEHMNLRRHILIRLLRARPYASIIAIRDDGAGGSKLLGDPSGIAANTTDATIVTTTTGASFRDTRIHVYEPCRKVPSGDAAMASDKRVWANWQGGKTLAGRENICERDAGETTQYVNNTQSSVERNESAWGH